MDDSVSHSEGVVIVSCDVVDPEGIISGILGVKSLPPHIETIDNLKGYPWLFETKYYTAEVNLYGLTEKKLYDSKFSDSIKAIIIYFDNTKLSSFEDVLSWMTFLKHFDSEVNLLVCNNCYEESDIETLCRKNILEWCLKNHFELVELDPAEKDDEDDAYNNFYGYARIIQAIQSHTWANLVLKDQNIAPCQSLIDKFMSETENLDDAKVNLSDKEKELDISNCDRPNNTQSDSTSNSILNDPLQASSKHNEVPSLFDENILDLIGNDDPGGESFESLFAKFASMKEKAENLTGDERKKYAEKVVIAFWRSLGGDEDEIAGLEDDAD